jgi:hypothetical protein
MKTSLDVKMLLKNVKKTSIDFLRICDFYSRDLNANSFAAYILKDKIFFPSTNRFN